MNNEEYRELKGLIEKRYSGLDKRFDTVGERFDHLENRIDERFEQVDRRFEQIDGRLVQSETSLRAEIRTSAAETRAHVDAVSEKFREDVKKIVEGYAHHASVLDDHEVRLTQLEQGRLRFDG